MGERLGNSTIQSPKIVKANQTSYAMSPSNSDSRDHRRPVTLEELTIDTTCLDINLQVPLMNDSRIHPLNQPLKLRP